MARRTRLMRVDLPLPEGPVMTKSMDATPLFDVLDVLADALELVLDGQALARDADVLRLGGQGVGLAVELLRQEIELTSDRLDDLGREEGLERIEVGPEPADLLGQVVTLGQERRLLGQLGLRDRGPGVEVGQAPLDLGLEKGRLALELGLGPGDEAPHRGQVAPHLAGRLLPLAAAQDQDVVEGPGEAPLDERGLFWPEGLAADLDELGDAEEAVEREIDAEPRAPGDGGERGQDLL